MRPVGFGRKAAAALRPLCCSAKAMSSRRPVNLAEARAQEQRVAAEARARGAASIDTHLVDGLFSVAFGTLVGAWYFGWLEGKASPVEQLVGRLRAREISVVVFELDHVMCGCDSRDGVLSHEVEDYFQRVSQDFAEAAAGLARRGFRLAAIADGQPPLRASSSRGLKAEHLLWGPDLARTLIAARCPDALPRFKIIVGKEGPEDCSRDHQMRKIAEFYGVPVQKLVLFTACKENFRKDVDGWTGVLVRNSREGFCMNDCQELEEPSQLGLSNLLDYATALVRRGREALLERGAR